MKNKLLIKVDKLNRIERNLTRTVRKNTSSLTLILETEEIGPKECAPQFRGIWIVLL